MDVVRYSGACAELQSCYSLLVARMDSPINRISHVSEISTLRTECRNGNPGETDKP
jgi:hypothetical protein